MLAFPDFPFWSSGNIFTLNLPGGAAPGILSLAAASPPRWSPREQNLKGNLPNGRFFFPLWCLACAWAFFHKPISVIFLKENCFSHTIWYKLHSLSWLTWRVWQASRELWQSRGGMWGHREGNGNCSLLQQEPWWHPDAPCETAHWKRKTRTLAGQKAACKTNGKSSMTQSRGTGAGVSWAARLADSPEGKARLCMANQGHREPGHQHRCLEAGRRGTKTRHPRVTPELCSHT